MLHLKINSNRDNNIINNKINRIIIKDINKINNKMLQINLNLINNNRHNMFLRNLKTIRVISIIKTIIFLNSKIKTITTLTIIIIIKECRIMGLVQIKRIIIIRKMYQVNSNNIEDEEASKVCK